jgi:tetratricopeptide (TPR) repeat protein
LVEELIRWAQQQGIVAIYTRSYGAEGELVYRPLAEALRSGLLTAQMKRLEPIWLAELARIYPELFTIYPELPRLDSSSEQSMTAQRHRLFEALARTFVGDRYPTILVLDDLQWCDRATLEWLHYLLHYDRQAPLLVIGTLRPEEVVPEHPTVQALLSLQASEIPYAELHLERMNAHYTAELAAAVAERMLALPVLEHIYQTTEGNPFFVVESIRASLAALSTSVNDAEGQFDIPSVYVLPPRVHAILRARLSQLSVAARDLAALAAVIGRSFTFEVLAVASEQDENILVRGLDELWHRQIVRAQGTNSYDFSHDRLREVAYAELSPIRRRQLHQRVARALEMTHHHNLDAVSAQLAYHFEQTGKMEQAIHYLQQAAGAARKRYAYQEAIAYLENAVVLVKAQPALAANLERELELQMALCNDWATITNYLGKEVEAAYHRALTLCQQLPYTPHLFTALWGLHEIALYRSDYQESLRLSEECLRIALELQHHTLLLQAHHALWGTYGFVGEHTKALAHIEAGLALYQPGVHEASSVDFGWHDAGSCARGLAMLALWNLGFLDQAAQRQQDLIDHTSTLALPVNIADGCGGVALFYHMRHAPDLARPYAERTMQIGVERGYPGARITGSITMGWSMAMQGEVNDGMALMQQGIAAADAMGQRRHYSQYNAMLAETCIAVGHLDEAIVVLDRAIAAFLLHRDLIYSPDLWRLKGEVLSVLGAAENEIEENFLAALTVARELGAKISELRAATALARLRQHQSRPTEAYQLLAPIYICFREGFEMVELQQAHALLAELVDP